MGQRVRPSPSTGSDTAGVDPESVVPHAGFFASHAEKAYRAGVVAYLRHDARACVDSMTVVLAAEPHMTSARLFAGLAADALGEEQLAITHLEAVLKATEPMPDALEEKYLPTDAISLGLHVQITDAIDTQAPFSTFGAAITLAQLYRDADRLADAIGVMEQLQQTNPGPLVRLSLADLLLANREFDRVVELTAGVANASDVDVELLHLRAAAFLGKGLTTAASDAFRDALAKTADRDPALLNAVRYDRALAYESQGQHARARADYERIYAADPDYEDVRQRLAQPN